MKNPFLLIGFTCLAFLSCSRPNLDFIPGSLEGIWIMVAVKDNNTGAVLTKPSSIQGDVMINIVPVSETTGTFTGKTPTNIIYQNDYSTEPGMSISIPGLSMTKVGETSWGAEFVYNITNARQYTFSSGMLSIITTGKTLSFQKR